MRSHHSRVPPSPSTGGQGAHTLSAAGRALLPKTICVLKADAAQRTEDLPAMVETLRAEFADLFGALPPITVRWEPYLLIRRLMGRWNDMFREIEVHPWIEAARLRPVLLHELCHATGAWGHGEPFQRLLRELAARGETWAAMELREYATKGTPEDREWAAAMRAAAGRKRRRTAPTEPRE